MGFWANLFGSKPKPVKPAYKQPRENTVPLAEFDGHMSAYAQIRAKRKRAVNGSTLDLIRGVFSMVEGGSDWEKAQLVNYGSRFEAEFADQAFKDEFKQSHPEFVAKVDAAIKYATTGE